MHLLWGRPAAAPPPDVWSRGRSWGYIVGEVAGLQDALLCADWLCTDLWGALWALCKLPGQTDLFTFAQDPNFGPRRTLMTLPKPDAASGKKSLPEQGSGSFGIKLVQLHWKPLPLQGKKTTNAEKAESALTPPFYRSKTGTSVIPPLPPHPCTCHILVTPLGFLIYCQVSPVHNDLHGLKSVLTT